MTKTIDVFLIIDVGKRDRVSTELKRNGGDVVRETLGAEFGAMSVTGLPSKSSIPTAGVRERYFGIVDVSEVREYEHSLGSEADYWNQQRIAEEQRRE
ncbi:MAG TPA: hypothetical protein VJI15_04240 [Candidatus Nanoarchaeia archaeon]|nr:hypothetical protein [Candidatus Nanoarchaeia archaeon]